MRRRFQLPSIRPLFKTFKRLRRPWPMRESPHSSGRQVRLFLVDGTPSGLMTAEVMNWTGKALAGPRARLGELIRREEASRTGVYVLMGPDPDRANGVKGLCVPKTSSAFIS